MDHLNKKKANKCWKSHRKKLAHHQLVLRVNVIKTDGERFTTTVLAAPHPLSSWLLKFFLSITRKHHLGERGLFIGSSVNFFLSGEKKK